MAQQQTALPPCFFADFPEELENLSISEIQTTDMGTMFKWAFHGRRLTIQGPPSRVQFAVKWRETYGGKKLDKPKMELVKNITHTAEGDAYFRYQTSMRLLQERKIQLILASDWAKKNKGLAERMTGPASDYYVVPMVREERDSDKIRMYGKTVTQKHSFNIKAIHPLNEAGEPDKSKEPIRHELAKVDVADRGKNKFVPSDLVRNTLCSEIFYDSHAFANGIRLTFATYVQAVEVLEFPAPPAPPQFEYSGFEVPAYNPESTVGRLGNLVETPEDDGQEPDETDAEAGSKREHDGGDDVANEDEGEGEGEMQSISSLMRTSKKARAN